MAFICKFCGSLMKTAWSLKKHEERHSGVGRFSCCGKEFFSKETLARHMCRVHGQQKQFVCVTCQKQFATKAELSRHSHHESSEAKFECDICGIKLMEKGDMKGHLATHSGETPYTCSYCDKRYRHRSSLSKHRSTKHAGKM